MNAIDHHHRAHTALDRAHKLLDLRALHADPQAEFYTDYHAWIARYFLFMASIALHVAVKNDRAAARILLQNQPD